MKYILKVTLTIVVIGFVGFLSGCGDDEPQVFDAPTLAVVANNTTPFADESVVFTIQANAPGGLNEITLDGQVIKTYSSPTTTDEFQHTVTLPAGTAFGTRQFNFQVNDNQPTPKTAIAALNIDVRDPLARGNPFIISRLDAEVLPAGRISSVTTAIQNQGWGDFAAGEFFFGVDNPQAGNVNKALRYKKANTWGWEQYVSADVDFINASQVSEDEWEAVAAGERVLQVNVYFEHVPQLNSETGVNESQVFPPDGGYIPVEVYIGDRAKWGFVEGFNLGRRIWLRGKITSNATWQTITFEAYDPDEDLELEPGQSNVDLTVGLNQINRISISTNPGGFQRTADGEPLLNGGFTAPFDHNNYFFYNLRLIDAEEKDNNPNL